MNYYERHIGDYMKDTAHLSLLEHGIYTRLLDVYYTREAPIPKAEGARLVGARTKEEREAVSAILLEFFEDTPDGWRQKRCDEEIARFHEGDEDRERREQNERERVRKHREDRARMFDALRAVGQTPRWNVGTDVLRELVKRYCNVTGAQPVTPPVTPPATEPVTPATATQTPVPSTQYPIPKKTADAHSQVSRSGPEPDPLPALPDGKPSNPEKPSRHGALARLLRDLGVQVTPFNPVLLEWVDSLAITDDEAKAAVEQARFSKPDGPIHAKYLDPIIRDMRTKPKPNGNGKPAVDRWWDSDAGIERKGLELGLSPGLGESWASFRARINAKLEQQRTAA